MSKTIRLPDNFIGKDDREKLESFGGHTVSHGRATRWHWTQNAQGDDVFEIYYGGENETLGARISRDRRLDEFFAHDDESHLIASGTREHVLGELETYFMHLHGETFDPSA